MCIRDRGYEVSDNCGTDEIMAGVQAAIYTITNPRDDGQPWAYESSDGWYHNSYEVNNTDSYVAISIIIPSINAAGSRGTKCPLLTADHHSQGEIISLNLSEAAGVFRCLFILSLIHI